LFYSRRNQERVEVRERLLSFGAEALVFWFAIQKFKDYPLGTVRPVYRTGTPLPSKNTILYIKKNMY
jgi:hypothetical protein